jgi:hypothetical protein
LASISVLNFLEFFFFIYIHNYIYILAISDVIPIWLDLSLGLFRAWGAQFMAISLDMAGPFLGPVLGMDVGPLWPISGYYSAFLWAYFANDSGPLSGYYWPFWC